MIYEGNGFCWVLTALILAGAGCGDEETPSVTIRSFEADRASVAPGDRVTLRWSIHARGHIELLTWVTLFDGEQSERTEASGVVKEGLSGRVEATEGSFVCDYRADRTLTCTNDEEPPESGSVVLSPGPQALTLRACTLGIDGSAAGSKRGDCDYQPLTLTLL